MNQTYLKVATLTLGCSLLVLWAVLPASSGSLGVRRQPQVAVAVSEQDPGFTHSIARIQGRLQTLRRLEKDMLSSSAMPEKQVGLRQKWQEARRSIDELVGKARHAAATDEERNQIEQYAVLASGTDERMRQVAAAGQVLEKGNQTGAKQQ